MQDISCVQQVCSRCAVVGSTQAHPVLHRLAAVLEAVLQLGGPCLAVRDEAMLDEQRVDLREERRAAANLAVLAEYVLEDLVRSFRKNICLQN